MKVLVAVTEVATVGDAFEIDGLGIAEGDLQFELNEWDAYALEEAVGIAEDREGVEVVAVTVGPARVEETLRKALAKGADRAVRVWDDALEGRPLLGVGTKARLLASVVEEEAPELALAGVQAADDAFGATGVALAEEAGFAWAAVVNGLTLEDGVAAVRRELEGGVEERSRVELPAVLTIQTGINEPRYASLRGIRQAQSTEIETRTLAELGLEPGAVEPAVELIEMYEPAGEDGGTLIEGTPTEQAASLAEVLRERGVGAG